MPRKGNAARLRRRPVLPVDVTLRRVIEALERDRPRDAVLLLLEHGPWDCRATLDQERQHPATIEWDDGPHPATATIGGELLAWLREQVHLQGTGLSGSGMFVPEFKLHGTAAEGRVRLAPQPIDRGFGAAGALRLAAILQFALLLEAVGIANVRVCSAVECPALYVKRYRRNFCSATCQKRTYMRQRRRDEGVQPRQRPDNPRAKSLRVPVIYRGRIIGHAIDPGRVTSTR
jgi:hypothetical protein